MHRDPLPLKRETEEEADRKLSTRAWGIVLGAWAALFAFLALVILPLLFSLCGKG